jgi:hypothetical protein
VPHQKRCEFQGAIHLITVRGYPGGQLFYDPGVVRRFTENPRAHAPDAQYFEDLLWETCEQYDGRVHAYVIAPNAALVVIQTIGAPLRWLVHDVLARYSRHLVARNRIPKGIKPFPRRYGSQIVQPAKLPYVVRYVHRNETGVDRRRRPINSPFSSHLIYYGRRPRPECFVVSATYNALAPLGYLGPRAYFEFMAASDSPSIADMLSRQIIGEIKFVDSVQERCRNLRRTPSPDDLLREVTATVLHNEPDIAYTSTHQGALARALVAWYAMRTGTAQISAVAQWFDVTSSDLRYLIRAHRLRSPHYFSKSLAELFPALARGEACPSSPRAPPGSAGRRSLMAGASPG